MNPNCPFCEHDPYEYVDIGVGMERVAVTCCELGVLFFDHRSDDDVLLSRDDFIAMGNKIAELRDKIGTLEELDDNEKNGDPRTPKYGVAP